jgi:hypothetical protein
VNRVLDFLDIVTAGMMIGPGLNVRLEATHVFQICFPTNSFGAELGWNTYWVDNFDASQGLALWSRYRPFTMGVHGGEDLPLPILSVNVGEIQQSPDRIVAGAHILLIGGHIGIRPVELVDFITGFVFIDLQSDDIHWETLIVGDPETLEAIE